jgi:hypothetical protein
MTGDVCTVPNQNIGIVLASANTILYGLLFAVGAYTPGDAEVFTVTAHGFHY